MQHINHDLIINYLLKIVRILQSVLIMQIKTIHCLLLVKVFYVDTKQRWLSAQLIKYKRKPERLSQPYTNSNLAKNQHKATKQNSHNMQRT